jgi:hypothetical protein
MSDDAAGMQRRCSFSENRDPTCNEGCPCNSVHILDGDAPILTRNIVRNHDSHILYRDLCYPHIKLLLDGSRAHLAFLADEIKSATDDKTHPSADENTAREAEWRLDQRLTQRQEEMFFLADVTQFALTCIPEFQLVDATLRRK